ncbi:cytochrome c oxidase subunit II [Candidatus Poribacteria bacterium]|nr:cytochrome c oxidase subunit II [Candidatus Poribacteria bacterium]
MLGWLPENISTFAQGVDTLFALIYWITVVVFVLVIGTLIMFLIKYRHRAGHRAEYIEGSTKLEIIWTAVTTVIVFGLAMLSFPEWNNLKSPAENPDYVVQVRGEQFNWYMIYPGPDNELGTEDDLELENELYVPVNKVVQILLTSKDVIHSFFIPNLRQKQDALPNRPPIDTLKFQAIKTGRYEIPCAELCGFGHSGMLGYLIVQTQEEYDAWVAEQWPE